MDFSNSTNQSTPPSLQKVSQQNFPKIPSDYLGSTPTSEQIYENAFKSPTSTQRRPHWMTQAISQGEPNLVNDPIDFLSDTSLLLTLSLQSTPSLTD